MSHGGFDQKPGGSTLVQGTPAPQTNTPGKQTLTQQLNPALGPEPGINKTGFVDHSDGANLRDAPAELGGQKTGDLLPSASRVFVSGTHPQARDWWYVTGYIDRMMVRGYVQGFRINTELPEPLAEMRQLVGGETAEGLAREKFGGSVTDGHDLRFYENVLLHVNQGRAGLRGAYQDPGLFGGGSNNVQLVAGHRIWLVSAAYAKTLQGDVPSGSLTGGAVAKARRFAVHLEDILHSVTESRHHFESVAGEVAQAIRDHITEIIGITAAFLMAEATSMFLAAAPTGVSQAAAVVIQLALAAFGAAGMVQGSIEALKHGSAWLNTAWTAHGKEAAIAEASREFIRMLVAIALAALSYMGAKGNYRNALKIGGRIPTGGLPAFATSGASAPASAGGAAAEGTAIGPSTGAFGAAMRLGEDPQGATAPQGGGGKTRVEEPVPGLYDGIDPTAQIPGWDMVDSIATEGRINGPHTEVLKTVALAPDGSRGWVERGLQQGYGPDNTLVLRGAFLEGLPKWIDPGRGPLLVPGKGIPTVTYMTMRQMKVLSVGYGALKKVKMSKIQNIRALIELHVLIENGVPPDVAVLQTHSVEYAKTTLIQSGHRIVSAKIVPWAKNGGKMQLNSLLDWYETGGNPGMRRNPSEVAKNDAIIATYGKGVVTRQTLLDANYDIELTVGGAP